MREPAFHQAMKHGKRNLKSLKLFFQDQAFILKKLTYVCEFLKNKPEQRQSRDLLTGETFAVK